MACPPLLAMHASAAHPERLKPCLRVHQVTIFVRDQERSLRFYIGQKWFNVVLTTDLTLRIVFILVAAMVDEVRQFRHAEQNDDIPLLVAKCFAH